MLLSAGGENNRRSEAITLNVRVFKKKKKKYFYDFIYTHHKTEVECKVMYTHFHYALSILLTT